MKRQDVAVRLIGLIRITFIIPKDPADAHYETDQGGLLVRPSLRFGDYEGRGEERRPTVRLVDKTAVQLVAKKGREREKPRPEWRPMRR